MIHGIANRFVHAAKRRGICLTRVVLAVSVRRQRMWFLERSLADGAACRLGGSPIPPPASSSAQLRFKARHLYRVSTSRFGIGQEADSNRTPLGLHRIARKIGAGYPIGTVLQGRQPVGYTWQGHVTAPIVHRILWLEGLEPGFNAGGDRDSFRRYIYIHGTSDESGLGAPASSGCIHLSANDLIPLFDRVPTGTLVWIEP